ncbi:hypothetical protein [Stutzerimonas stutzeri]|uniref:hypothetical protein n=1 Tax=Stutzerimonas stutzeri TaxID=316 RepID=UPI000F7ABFD5|nr:hypothetical protein [Stutzerimonas stutzeri]MCP3432990.1 hypothetical protein [Stutzerimonas stutzeri]RTM25047.1 hypothetical protein EKN22_04935 [Stutzerimonas stutzeri]
MSEVTICAFCGKSPPEVRITKEHVLAKKFRDRFPEAPNQRRWNNKVYIYSGDTDPSFACNIPQGPFNSTIRRVCNECNNGWMSTLENEADPYLMSLIYGEPVIRDNQMRIILSAWAAKTAAVYALLHKDGVNAVPDFHYRYLHDTNWAPPYTHVWRGSGEFNSNTMLRYVRGSLERDANECDHVHLSAIWIGHAVFYVLGFPNEYAEAVLIEEISLLDQSPIERLWPLEQDNHGNVRSLAYDEVRALSMWKKSAPPNFL